MADKIYRHKVYHKYNGHCAYCGNKIEFKKMQVDHIIPKDNFYDFIRNSNLQIPKFLRHLTYKDLNHIDNLNPSCAKCNNFKDKFSIETFREQIKLQVERLNSYITQYQRARLFGLVVETKNEVVFYFEKFNK